MRFAIIGTSFISDRFMAAAGQIPEFKLKAVYSRSKEKGQAFADKYGAELLYTSLEELADSKEVDAVYIASPNSCHASQAIQMLSGGKHVLCEKPIAADSKELADMLKAAGQNKVILLEAIRSVFDPGFAMIEELLPRIGTVRRAFFTFCQYSSRYDRFKQGVTENAFNPRLSNAALMDIGVYCVHPMVKLFGLPKSIQAQSIFLHNGMEGLGTAVANYDSMLAELQYSKITQGYLPSQIQGEQGAMLIYDIPDTKTIELCCRDGRRERIEIHKKENNMYYEIKEFIRLANRKEKVNPHNQYSVWQMKVMDEIRRCAGIKFD